MIASNLSAAAQERAREAIARRNEVTRLFDLTRDVLLTTETTGAIEALARHVARRFELSGVAICLPAEHGWRMYQGGSRRTQHRCRDAEHGAGQGTRNASNSTRASVPTAVTSVLETRNDISIVPLRHGTKAVGLLAASSSTLDIGTLDAVAGVVAIAIERTQFLADRDAAELVRQKADLAATLLASLSHDLRTPLTAIRVAVENLRGELPADERREQARAAITELARLTRLLQDILDMARIDAAAIRIDRDWVTAEDVVDASIAHVRHLLEGQALRVEAMGEMEVEIDPRLASVALSHILENAAQYSPPDREIAVQAARRARRLARLGDRPRAWPRPWRARPSLRAVLPRAQCAPGHGRNGHGAVDHARPACGRRRTGLGGERARRRRKVLDGDSWSGSPGRGATVAMPSRILIVDDEPNILGTVSPLLRARGYEVLSAMSGRAGLDAVERDKPDLIVLDLGLPDMDGVDVCRAHA